MLSCSSWLAGAADGIFGHDTCTSAQRETLTQTANYFERNLPYMDYPVYLRKGWPIASGVIEGACRHFVKDRFELSGMRWSQNGAEHLLHLRAVAENDDWDEYHGFRKRRRHTRLYELSFPKQCCLEDQALTLDVLFDSSTGSDREALPAMAAVDSIGCQIPLAA